DSDARFNLEVRDPVGTDYRVVKEDLSMKQATKLGDQLAKAFWVVSRSIAMVLYARVSNLDDRAASADITLTLLKVSFLLVIALLLPALLVPDALYALVFGEEFFRVKAVLWYLSPGIASIAVNGILSHYFSGTGRPAINAWAAGLGLLVTLVLGVILIPRNPMAGAGITASAAYAISTLYLLIRFLRDAGRSWRSLRITREERAYLLQAIRQRLG
ncbi:MAG: polysaccharide biosynthesis C-terminal domain-containing protein, partial [Bacteroidota bacterium]